MKWTQEIINKQAITKQLSVCEFVRKKTTKTQKKAARFYNSACSAKNNGSTDAEKRNMWGVSIYTLLAILVKLSWNILVVWCFSECDHNHVTWL